MIQFSFLDRFFSDPSKKKQFLIRFAVGGGIVLFILLNVFLYRWGRESGKQLLSRYVPTPTPSPTPTPYPIKGHGKRNFTVMSGSRAGPQFIQGFIDPIDIEPGKTQTVSVNMTSQTPVVSGSVRWHTDHKMTTMPMKLVEGKATNGRWEAKWPADDTIWYIMDIRIEAYDGTATSSNELSLR